MHCERCSHRNRGASWYCANCGAPLSDLNVADSVGRPPLPRLVRLSLIVSVGALATVALVTLALTGARRMREGRVAATPVPATIVSRPTTAPMAGAATRTSPPPAETSPAVTGPPPGTVLTATPEARLTPRTRPVAPVWRATRLDRPPALDGDLADWPGQPIDITAVVFGETYWTGPADLRARAFLGWDESALYLGVRVNDDVFSQPASGGDLYLGDSLELQIDADLEGDWASGAYNADDYHIGLSPGDFLTTSPQAWVWRPANRMAPSVALSARQLEDGYVIEAAVPWALVGLEPGTRAIGLALNVSDNDLAEPAQLTMISSTPTRSWSDPRSFGTFVLGD